jgi:LPXTG-site transpeptidase (sortase) family protein
MSKLPPGTQDLYDMLGVHDHAHGHDSAHAKTHEGEPGHDEAVELELPTAAEASERLKVDLRHEGEIDPDAKFLEHEQDTNTFVVNLTKLGPLQVVKNIAPFIIIFVVGMLMFMFIFTDFSLTSTLSSVNDDVGQNEKAETPAAKLSEEELVAYRAWIGNYFFDVTDPSVLDPNNDISGNGLTNYQKYLLNLNPKKQDTMGLGMTDTEALMEGINPLTGSKLTELQKQIIAQYIDLESVSNKLSLAAANSSPKVAGINTASADTFRQEATIDTTKPAELNIPSLNIKAPVIWTKDPKNFTEDLRNGVVHYPGTPLPGEMGTSYVSGHSSNYVWERGNYNQIFAGFGQLKKFDSFSITATDMDGKKVTFHYVIAAIEIFKADDQKQFANIGKSTVALSTCWPIGTSAKRMVAFGHLSQVSK